MEFDRKKQTFLTFPEKWMTINEETNEERVIKKIEKIIAFRFAFIYENDLYVFKRNEYTLILGRGKIVILDKEDNVIPFTNEKVRNNIINAIGNIVFVGDKVENKLWDIDLNKVEEEKFNKFSFGNSMKKQLKGIL